IDATDGTMEAVPGKKPRKRRIRFNIGRDKHLAEATDSEIKALRAMNKRRAVKEPWVGERGQSFTLQDVEKAYLGSQDFAELRGQRPRRGFLKRTVERLGATLEAASLTPVQIHQFIEERRKAGVSGTTINHEMAALNVALEWCVKHGKLTVNPIAGFEREA